MYFWFLLTTFHLATRSRVTEFANRIGRALFNSYFNPVFLYIVTIEQTNNADVNSAHSSSGATPDIPPLCDDAGRHVAHGEEPSVPGPDTTDTREKEMSLTNVPSPESVVYDGVVTSTPGTFSPVSGVFREPLGDLSRDPIISSNISNWETALQSTISGLGQQMFAIADKIDNNTKTLQDQISLSECRTNSHLKSLERNVSSLESSVSSLQKDVHIFQIQTDSKLNAINGKILQLDTNILNVDSKLTSFQVEVNSKFETLDNKFSVLDNKISVVDDKLEKVNNRLDSLEGKIDNIDNRVDKLDSSVNSINVKLNNFITDQTKFNDITDKKISDLTEATAKRFLDIDTNVRQVKTNIRSMDETIQSNTREIQDITKLIDVRKAEIRNELTESFNQSRDRLDQKVDSYCYSLKSDVDRLTDDSASISQRLFIVEQSLDGIPLNVKTNSDKIDAVCKQVQASQPGYVSDYLMPTSQLPDTSPKTPVILKRSQPGVSAETSNNQVNTPVQNLNTTSFNSPTQNQNKRSYETSFLNICGGSLNPNAVNTPGSAKFMGRSPSQIMNQGTSYFSSPSPTLASDNLHVNQSDTSAQLSAGSSRGPSRILPTYDGVGDVDLFFKRFEYCIESFNWSEGESLSRLLTDSLQGKAAEMLQCLPADFQMNYANIKYKLFSFFAPKHDRDYYVKQLEGITRNSGELLQDFCNRVSFLANKAYPFSSTDMNKHGIKALINGCNSNYASLAMLSRDFSDKTIEEASAILHDVVEKTSRFSEKEDSLRLRALRSDNPYNSDRHSTTPSLNRDRRPSSSRSHDYVPRDPSPRNYNPGSSSLNRDERFSDSKSYNYSSRDRSRESSPHNRDRNFSGGRSHDYYKYNRDSSYDHIPRGILKSSDHYSSRRHSPSPKRQDDWDRRHRDRQSRTPPHSPSHGHHSAKHSSRQSYSPRGDQDSSKGCYACGSHDHFVKDCPTTPKSSSNNQCCFNCESPNHFVKDCPHRSPRSRTPSPFNKNSNNVHFKDKGSKNSPK